MDAHTTNTYEGETPENAEHVAEMLDKADALEAPDVSDRPEWLPEKFKSPEDLAKAYTELQKKLGSREAPEDPPDNSQDVIEESDNSDGPALNFDSFSQEYSENGGLSDDSYDALEAAGIPRSVVDQYIAGLEATQGAIEQEAYNLVGGQQEYQTMVSWAAANLPEARIEAFNRAVNSGDNNLIQMAIQGLNAQYRSQVGTEPNLIRGETRGDTGGIYSSVAQLTEAMRDPRYTKDPAFREEVARKLSRSNIL